MALCTVSELGKHRHFFSLLLLRTGESQLTSFMHSFFGRLSPFSDDFFHLSYCTLEFLFSFFYTYNFYLLIDSLYSVRNCSHFFPFNSLDMASCSSLSTFIIADSVLSSKFDFRASLSHHFFLKTGHFQ